MEFIRFETVADSLAAGCLLAGVRGHLHQHEWYVTLLNSKYLLFLPFLILLITWVGRFPEFCPKSLYSVGAITIQNILIAVFIDRVITNYQGRMGKFLNAAPIAFIGAMSYSIYLWQQLFLNPELSLPIIVKLMLVAFASLASFFLVEKSSLKLRGYLETKFIYLGNTNKKYC